MANQLPSALTIDKIWWIKDPPPIWLFLEKEQQIELSKIQLQAQLSLLKTHMDVTQKSLDVLNRAK